MPRKSINYNLGGPEDYNPIILSRMPEADLRAEYARLRRVARDRIRRIERSEFAEDSTWIEDRGKDFNLPASRIRAADLPSALSDLAGFLEAKTSTVTGLRRKRSLTLEALKDAGITGINRQNYGAFTQFMKATQVFKNAYIPYPKRSEKVSALQDAKQIRPAMFMLTQKGISQAAIIRNFEFFKNNLKDVQNLISQGKINSGRQRPYSANEIRRMLGMEPEAGYRSDRAARNAAKDVNRQRRSNAHKKKR